MQRCSRLAHAVDDMQHLVRSAVDVLGHRVIVVVVEIDVAGELLQRFNALLYSAVPPRKADLVLQLQDRTLAALDGVAYTLAGDAEVVLRSQKGRGRRCNTAPSRRAVFPSARRRKNQAGTKFRGFL